MVYKFIPKAFFYCGQANIIYHLCAVTVLVMELNDKQKRRHK